jgi:hypothetical protein
MYPKSNDTAAKAGAHILASDAEEKFIQGFVLFYFFFGTREGSLCHYWGNGKRKLYDISITLYKHINSWETRYCVINYASTILRKSSPKTTLIK